MRVKSKGIGAHDQDLDVKPLTLLVGENGSGKSKTAEAIRFGALGYIPQLGKRPVDSAALMHGDSMSAEIDLGNGKVIRRTITRKDEGYTAWAEASWIKNGKQAEHDKEIKALFGREEVDVAESLDIRTLLAATPNQRCSRMEALLKAGERSADEIADAVARLWIMRLADTTEDRMPKEYMKAFELIPETQQPVVREVGPMLYGKIKEAGIPGAITWANAEKREMSEGLKHKEAAAHELRKRAAEVPEPDERDITRLEKEREKLLQEFGAAKQKKIDYDLRIQNLGSLKGRLTLAMEQVKRADQEAKDAEATNGKAAKEFRDRSDKVLELMGSLKLAPEEDDSEILKLEAESKGLSEQAEAIMVPSVPDTTKAEREVADLKAQIKLAELSEWSEVLSIAQDIEDMAVTKGIKTAVAKSLKRLRELAKQGLGTDPADLKHALDGANQALKDAMAQREKMEAARKKAEDQRETFVNRANAKREEAMRLRKGITERRRSAIQAFDAKRAELAIERQNLEKALEAHRKALESARDAKTKADRDLASLRDRLQGAGETPDAPADPAIIERKLNGAGDELSKLIAARATHTEIHAVLSQIEAAKAEAVVYAAAEWALQRQREIEISSSGGPLMRIMTEFLKAAGRKETPFVRASQGTCAIGWKRDGVEIRVEALSGGEFVLLAAALTAAVTLCRKSVLKILLVEAGETDQKTLTQLLEGIQGVNREELMTAIVMSPRSPTERVDHLEAWDVIRINEGKEAAVSAA